MRPGCGGKPAVNENRMNKELSAFAARLREAMDGRGATLRRPDSVACCPCLEFDSLALELFALQFKYNPTYRKICEAQLRTPDDIEHWTRIPAVPTAAFKELELSGIPPEERTAVFHSSGTTGQKPSRHFHCPASLELYEVSLWGWFLDNVVPDLRSTIYDLRAPAQSAIGNRQSAIFLAPPPEQAPYSSLVHMFETVRRRLGFPESAFVGSVLNSGARLYEPQHILMQSEPLRVADPRSENRSGHYPFVGKLDAAGAWTLDFDAAVALLNSSLDTRHPSLLLGTAFSFLELVDYLAEKHLQFALPPGSRVMETGGYKNRSRSLPKTELHALITKRLGVPPENILCEYGMSELSSQAYAMGAAAPRGHFRFPPWARARVISPETGREVAEGETGLLQVFDLANVFSVMAIQTEDLGVRRGDGFELIGRARLAEPRGCSLMTA